MPVFDEALIKILPLPIVDKLDDIPGGQENLLCAAALADGLKVEIPMWPNTHPTPATPERLELFLGDQRVDYEEWTSPVPAADLHRVVSRDYLREGLVTLHYRVRIYNGEEEPSLPLTLTIDTMPPQLNSNNRLQFPSEVEGDGVTVQYLERNNDQVQATVPAYQVITPGDVLTWYWEREPDGMDKAGDRTLTQDDVGQILELTFDGDMIRARGDGDRYVTYEVRDRAGNLSQLSRSVRLRVAAIPAPRELPRPSVDKATPGAPGEGQLNPTLVSRGGKVLVPATATIEPHEQVRVHWLSDSDSGSYESPLQPLPEPREFAIPASVIAACMGKTAEVFYAVMEADGPVASDRYRVHVQRLQLGATQKVKCAQAEFTPGELYLSSAPDGADFTQLKWIFIAPGQLINMWLEGLDQNGVALPPLPILTDHAVTPAEVDTGVTERLPRQQLLRLKLNETFAVHVRVSFDEGQSQQVFQSLDLKLRS